MSSPAFAPSDQRHESPVKQAIREATALADGWSRIDPGERFIRERRLVRLLTGGRNRDTVQLHLRRGAADKTELEHHLDRLPGVAKQVSILMPGALDLRHGVSPLDRDRTVRDTRIIGSERVLRNLHAQPDTAVEVQLADITSHLSEGAPSPFDQSSIAATRLVAGLKIAVDDLSDMVELNVELATQHLYSYLVDFMGHYPQHADAALPEDVASRPADERLFHAITDAVREHIVHGTSDILPLAYLEQVDWYRDSVDRCADAVRAAFIEHASTVLERAYPSGTRGAV